MNVITPISEKSFYTEENPEDGPRSSCSFSRVIRLALMGIALVSGYTYLTQSPPSQPHSSSFPNFLATVKTREIAKQLGAPYPDQFTIYTNPTQFSQAMQRKNDIHLSPDFVQSLLRNPHTDYTQEEIEGVVAHEIGHLVLGHEQTDNPIYAEMDAEPDFDKSFDMYPAISRKLEKEADLFTLKVPAFAKGLVLRLKRALAIEGPEIAKPDDLHPLTEERIRYLTKGYCQSTGGADLDLCHQCNTTSFYHADFHGLVRV
jgi:hypothetical protein